MAADQETSPGMTDEELLAFLDEELPAERASEIEQQLRSSSAIRQRAALLIRGRDHGAHTIGGIWRRGRLSCLSRKQLGTYLLGAADPETLDYLEFHLHTVGCRYCQANLADLEAAQREAEGVQERRRRFFESSAGLLRE